MYHYANTVECRNKNVTRTDTHTHTSLFVLVISVHEDNVISILRLSMPLEFQVPIQVELAIRKGLKENKEHT